MQKTIIDSGPLIALFDKDDRYHKSVVTFLKGFRGELITTWSVITEASHMLDFSLKAQLDFLRWVHIGGVRLYEITQEDLEEIIGMMTKYSDIPMDLADASLMYIANKEKISNIVSIDSDFDIYELKRENGLLFHKIL